MNELTEWPQVGAAIDMKPAREQLKKRAERQIAEDEARIEKQKRLIELLEKNPEFEEILNLLGDGMLR